LCNLSDFEHTYERVKNLFEKESSRNRNVITSLKGSRDKNISLRKTVSTLVSIIDRYEFISQKIFFFLVGGVDCDSTPVGNLFTKLSKQLESE